MKTIYVIDDLDIITNTIKYALDKYNVVVFNNPLEALKNINESIDLIITDYKMPEMNGIELAIKINKINPNVPIFLTSGYQLDNIPKCITKLLQKPFSLIELIEIVKKELE